MLWWWSDKADISIMMRLLDTAYLRARLGLRRPAMRRATASVIVAP